MRILVWLAVFVTMASVCMDAARAEKRVALVIGNAAYSGVTPLRNPVNDATDLTAALKQLGFEVLGGIDLDQAAMRAEIRKFSVALRGADVGLFFFAGHGLEVSNQNFLIPVDAAIEAEADLDFQAVPLDLVFRQMTREAKTTLIFLDACRDNPMAEKLARSMGARSVAVGRGLARVESGLGSYIAFATEPGKIALDGNGRNSPFTAALLRHIASEGRDISSMMIAVRNDVLKETGGKQLPWDHSALTGQFFFKVAAPKPVAPPPIQVDELAALKERLKQLEGLIAGRQEPAGLAAQSEAAKPAEQVVEAKPADPASEAKPTDPAPGAKPAEAETPAPQLAPSPAPAPAEQEVAAVQPKNETPAAQPPLAEITAPDEKVSIEDIIAAADAAAADPLTDCIRRTNFDALTAYVFSVDDRAVDRAGAVAPCEAALSRDPDRVELTLRLARALIATRQKDRARTLLDPLIRGKHPEALTLAGALALASVFDAIAIATEGADFAKDLQLARETLREAIASGSFRAETYLVAVDTFEKMQTQSEPVADAEQLPFNAALLRLEPIAAKGDPVAANFAAILREQKETEDGPWMQRAADIAMLVPASDAIPVEQFAHWIMVRARAGDPLAMSKAALLIAADGDAKRLAQAARLVRIAQDLGARDSRGSLAELLLQRADDALHRSTALDLLREGARGEIRLGPQTKRLVAFLRSAKTSESESEAAALLRRAAELGDRNAQLELAGMYREGIGVPKDQAEADRILKLPVVER